MMLNKIVLWISPPMIIGFLIYACLQPDINRMFVVMACLISFMIPIQIIGREEKLKGNALTCSLPVKRGTIVLAKYLMGWLSMSACLVFSIIFGLIFPGSMVEAGQLLTLKTLFIAFVVFTILLGTVLPFAIRFGHVGLMLFLVGCQVLGIILFMIAALAGSFRSVIQSFFAALSGIKSFLLAQGGEPFYYGVLVALLVLLNLVSFFVSKALYARREF
jgi:hypothetical protein